MLLSTSCTELALAFTGFSTQESGPAPCPSSTIEMAMVTWVQVNRPWGPEYRKAVPDPSSAMQLHREREMPSPDSPLTRQESWHYPFLGASLVRADPSPHLGGTVELVPVGMPMGEQAQ